MKKLEAATRDRAAAAWRERSLALKNLTSLPAAPVPASLDARLRPYQRLGAAWLHLLAAAGP